MNTIPTRNSGCFKFYILFKLINKDKSYHKILQQLNGQKMIFKN